jgi:XTP/dITP diphosphohydrolase
MQKLLHEMQGISNRKARFRTVIALVIGSKKYFFEGAIEGKITEGERGTAGFGYDPIFEPTGYTQTFAELGDDVKNQISHRALATREFVEWIKDLGF